MHKISVMSFIYPLPEDYIIHAGNIYEVKISHVFWNMFL